MPLRWGYRVLRHFLQAEIKSLVEKVCDILPASYKRECDDLIAQYEPEIVQLIISELSPKEICVLLGLCPKSRNTVSSGVSGLFCWFVFHDPACLLRCHKNVYDVETFYAIAKNRAPALHHTKITLYFCDFRQCWGLITIAQICRAACFVSCDKTNRAFNVPQWKMVS